MRDGADEGALMLVAMSESEPCVRVRVQVRVRSPTPKKEAPEPTEEGKRGLLNRPVVVVVVVVLVEEWRSKRAKAQALKVHMIPEQGLSIKDSITTSCLPLPTSKFPPSFLPFVDNP